MDAMHDITIAADVAKPSDINQQTRKHIRNVQAPPLTSKQVCVQLSTSAVNPTPLAFAAECRAAVDS